MNSAESFSATYAEARAKFREAVQEAGGALEAFANPNRGPDNGDLSTDVAWFGPKSAEKVLVMVSGTHGVEGFCGSGAQVDWLRRGEQTTLPAGTAALLVHAINPFGFAWLRRVTEENVDLNRNWVDFAEPLPQNPGYDELATTAVPEIWNAESQAASNRVLRAYAAEHGPMALQQALSGGQYRHPNGVFYGGDGPSWARRTQEAIYADYLGNAGRIAIIDYHTGLGPWGYAEPIMSDRAGSAGHDRGLAWFGAQRHHARSTAPRPRPKPPATTSRPRRSCCPTPRSPASRWSTAPPRWPKPSSPCAPTPGCTPTAIRSRPRASRSRR